MCRIPHASARGKKGQKVVEVSGKIVTRAPPDPYVDIVALPDAPPVAFEIAAEEQLRRVRRNRRSGIVCEELRFPGDDRRGPIALPLQDAGNRTEVAACADENRRFKLIVGNPAILSPPQRDQRRVIDDAHSRPPQ
jgi:hypothetical protein